MVTPDASEPRFLYEESALALIRDSDARDHLSRRGLPAGNPLFFPVPAYPHAGEDREFVVIGHDGTGLYCVDVVTGEVVITGLEAEAGIGHVNASPQAFDRCIAEFVRGLPYGSKDSEREELESISENVGRALYAIDASVFDDDPGFWPTLLNDVALGDYVEA
ncbi:SUKH-4 family immunity protein [Paractinoplanes atraurantiacus]|uniref:SUKH-4 immunity protein n=1 Tax=Paractinoplanes atraurantiacus TaxID=1036182 RepID=A0A285J3C8_9ACTN|nr:SUKH-4 family immunity protein [Actinoplanes atraurantiacus]SNY53631.1 SUKH-4 immunity protein [Actinoplanes atraurantiacus]